jgi:hypothetical protein
MPQTSSKELATIAALELTNAILNPVPVAPFSHIGTAQLQALDQVSDIFMTVRPPTETPHSPPTFQSSSQFRNTIHPARLPMLGPPCPAPPSPSPSPTYLATPNQPWRLARYPSLRASPSQAPSPRVSPRVNPRHVHSRGCILHSNIKS